MIQQIKLRGISRDPSDRMNADGGCAESMNVQLNNDELEPTPVPVVANTALDIPTTLKVLYIHKSNTYTNYVGTIGSSVYAKLEGEVSSGANPNPQEIVALQNGETIVGMTSVGNILVLTTSLCTHYAIFRDGRYTYLGDSVPEPKVTFMTVYGQIGKTMSFDTQITFGNTLRDATQIWNYVMSKVGMGDTEGLACTDFYNNVMNELWANVILGRASLRGNKEFAAPVLARYALRLYDGNYIYVSAPVLLFGKDVYSAAWHEHIDVISNLGPTGYFTTKITFCHAYTASVRVDFGEGGLWGDLIESVDIFLSTEILVPKMESKLGQAYDTGSHTINPDATNIGNDCGHEFEGVSDYAWLGGAAKNRFKEDFETAMLEKGNFYRVATIPAFQSEYWVEALVPKSEDDLVVLPRLSEGDAHQVSGLGGVGSFNERLILSGERITLSRGNQRPDAINPLTHAGPYVNLSTVFFYIRTDDGGVKVVRGYHDYDILNAPLNVKAYITYPDPRCFKAEYYESDYYGTSIEKVTIPMKEHPRLNCAYGFWGLGYGLSELYPSGSGDTREKETVLSIPTAEDRTYDVENRLFLSGVDNPFYFPLGQRVTFSSRIIAVAPITIPLSTYQFGQRDLYVFTEEGIWAESINEEGKIASNHPVTRDVALPGSVCQLDMGIIFATKQGVMLLTENGAQNISPSLAARRDMLGKNGTITGLGDWQPLMNIALDTTSFLEFIQAATFSYDYPGKRILAFNAGKSYAWVYKLDTATWHRQQNPSSLAPALPLNSYPEALVSMVGTSSFSVVDYTTVRGVTPEPLRTALVITRSIDLELPDVRKQLKDIRVKGFIGDGGSAQLIIMGSMDGIYYDRVTTLRSGSYKFYKLAILLKLYPNERVSWVDVDFEPRFQNKLR